jgi:hypothetical protein
VHPQQIRQLPRVPLVVFDPPIIHPDHSARMRQMHLRADGLQH